MSTARMLGLVGLLLMLAACQSGITIDARPSAPPVSAASLPITVGVYYPATTRGFRHSYPYYGGVYEFDVGTPSVALLDGVFARMFDKVVPVSRRPPLTGDAAVVAAVIEVGIEDFAFGLTPFGDTSQATVRYRATMLALDGSELGSWPAMGQGSASGMFAPSHAREATELAIRNGVAEVAAGFAGQTGIQSWLHHAACGSENRDPIFAGIPRESK